VDQLQQLLKKISNAQAQHCLNSLSSPGDKDAFAFGYRCGALHGLRETENLVRSMIADIIKEDK
jgi:hypothetical protein